MIAILSPAKTIDFTSKTSISTSSLPRFLDEAGSLVEELRKLSPGQISELMKTSDKLSNQTYEQYRNWISPPPPSNSKQAILAFRGEVYSGLRANTFSIEDFLFAQDHVFILSGLYGVLRALDLIMPYRLEMGTKYSFQGHTNLYNYWSEGVTLEINNLIKAKERVLINLASNEYFQVINKKLLQAQIITPVFKDLKNDSYKVISIYAKKARGEMANYIIKNQIKDPEDLKHFEGGGYYYNDRLSSMDEIVFTTG